jgi:drug/metabolite transporter (DMT)-like permease
MNTTNKESLAKGTVLIVLAAFCFSLVGVCIRMAGDLPVLQKSFFRNIVALFVSYLVLRRSGVKPSLALFAPNLRLLFLRSFMGTVGMFCNFYAIDHLLLGDAAMLAKMSPFFVVLFSALFLRERVSPAQILCILGAFVGSLFIIKPSFSNLLLIPSLVGLLGGISSGAAHTAVRSLGKKGQQGALIVFFFSLFSTLVTIPPTVFAYHSMTLEQLGWLLCTGLMAALGQFAITGAYRFAPANRISVYDYGQVLFSALLGLVLFSQIPDRYSMFGYFIVIGMGFSMYFINRKNQLAAGFSLKKS